MALVTICGYPCSGKSRRAEQIKAALEKRLAEPANSALDLSVTILSDDVLNLDRSSYDNSRAEKPAHSALFTAMQRQMSPRTVLIVDSLNYIKGFRYQMYCAAREFKLRVCTVYVVATHEHCRRWNAAREDGRQYKQETLDNLLLRFEEPSSMVRWDSPLFTVPWTDETPAMDDIWRAVTEGNVKPPNVGTQAVTKAPTDALQTLEQTATSIVSEIMSAQAASGGSLGTVSLGAHKVKLTLPQRTLTLSELQRLKRQFVTVHKKAITLGSTEKGAVDWTEESVAGKFAEYLEENLKS